MKVTVEGSVLKEPVTVEAKPTTLIADLKRTLYENAPTLKQQGISLEELQKKLILQVGDTVLKENQPLASHMPEPTDTSMSLTLFKPEIPKEFFCPITCQILLSPVALPCEAIVEKEAIERWIQQKKSSPFTRQPLTIPVAFDI